MNVVKTLSLLFCETIMMKGFLNDCCIDEKTVYWFVMITRWLLDIEKRNLKRKRACRSYMPMNSLLGLVDSDDCVIKMITWRGISIVDEKMVLIVC